MNDDNDRYGYGSDIQEQGGEGRRKLHGPPIGEDDDEANVPPAHVEPAPEGDEIRD